MPVSTDVSSIFASKALGTRKKKSTLALEALLELLKSYSPGEKLPSEREVASTLNMTRVPVREAMVALQIAGHINIEPGVGAFVLANFDEGKASSGLTLLAESESPSEVRALRRLLEVAIVRSAVSNLNQDKLDDITKAYEKMHAAYDKRDRQAYILAHRDFHYAIAVAAGNSLFERLEGWILYEVMSQPIWEKVMYARLKREEVRMKKSLDEHAAVFDAVRNGNANRAAQLVMEHFKHVLEQM